MTWSGERELECQVSEVNRPYAQQAMKSYAILHLQETQQAMKSYAPPHHVPPGQ